jgi:uncharacterized membrane protein
MATLLSWRLPDYPQITVRHVPVSQSLEWLRRAWEDMQDLRFTSLAHGLLISLMGGVLLMVGSSHPYFIAAAVTGYLLVGPLVTTGLCELSRRRAAGEPLGFDESLQPVARHPRDLFQFGAILAAIAVVWFVVSEVMLQTILPARISDFSEALWGGFTNMAGRAQIFAYVASGAVLAVIVFALSVVAVPLIIDRHISAMDAMWISVKATWANLPAMLVWSGIIVGLTAVGFLGFLMGGMVLVAPLLGHATWHAYRDLIAET